MKIKLSQTLTDENFLIHITNNYYTHILAQLDRTIYLATLSIHTNMIAIMKTAGPSFVCILTTKPVYQG